MTHQRAVFVMVIVTLLWSTAGVVTRHLDSAQGFEVTFWRSSANALALVVLLSWRRGPAPLWLALRHADRAMWWSGLCWAVMFTAFVLAITMTTVANVLVTMALAPLFTALAARALLGQRLPGRTWGAVVLAGIGIAWMFGHQAQISGTRHWIGTAIAVAVPLAAAANWILLQEAKAAAETSKDLMPAVLIGAILSAVAVLPFALPFEASARDVGLLSLLGLVQLAIPCLLAVGAARALSAPEAALLALLEVIFGVAWAWLGAGEALGPAALAGGLLVLFALAGNEALSLYAARQQPRPPRPC